MRKIIGSVRFFTLILSAAFVFSMSSWTAFAYSTPFAPAKPASPGEVNKAAEVKYALREGGTFIYQNNPEQIFSYNIGKALSISDDLTGDVFFSSENRSNIMSPSAYIYI